MAWKRIIPMLILTALFASGATAPPPAAAKTEDKYERSLEKYTIPDVTLVNQDGERIRLLELVDDVGKPVMVDFIYGTCTTICPVLSAGYASFQRRVGPEAAHLISISIDPEHDTPEIMTEYLRRYGAKPGWNFFTGSRSDIDKVMRAFDAYVENKMSHYPITFLKAPGQDQWVRIYGLLGSKDLIREVEKLTPEASP